MNVDPKYDVVFKQAGVCTGCGGKCPKRSKTGYCKKCTEAATVHPEVPDTMAQAAHRERVLRELARRRLLPYTQRIKPDYMAGWFHVDLAARLERFVFRVERGESPRLIINVPPRRGKTELASRSSISWALGRNPGWGIISATHSDRLATDNSRDVLDYVRHPFTQAVFPELELKREQKGATGWRTTEGGVYKPVGVGAGIAGYGAHILDIDDPHRDKDAYSPTVRDNIWRWYSSSARTRLMPGGGILLIQTRWVLDDLTGRVLEEEGLVDEGGQWEQVVYPEEAVEDEYRLPNGRIVHEPLPKAQLLRNKGETLHPERWDPADNEQHKKDKLVWAAVWQQDPTAGDAAVYKRAEFGNKTLADIPKNITHYTTADGAVTTKERSDWSVIMTFGVDEHDNIWLVDVDRRKIEPDEFLEALIDNYFEFRPLLSGVEKTQAQIALGPFLTKRIQERKAWGMSVEELLHGNKDKVSRARPMQARARQGKVFIPVDAPWYETLVTELEHGIAGSHDDQYDCFNYMGQLMDTLTGPAHTAPKPKQSWRDKLDAHVAGQRPRNWRTA